MNDFYRDLSPVLENERDRLEAIARRLVQECWAETTNAAEGRFINYAVRIQRQGQTIRIFWVKQIFIRASSNSSRRKLDKALPLKTREKTRYTRRDFPECKEWQWDIIDRFEIKFDVIRRQLLLLGTIAQKASGYGKLIELAQNKVE
jgi:hypothetical protein